MTPADVSRLIGQAETAGAGHAGNNRLAILGADIRQAHADISRGAQAMAERALAAGHMLLEAKAALPHGEWGTWLQAHTGLSARTARLYAQLARSGAKTATVAEMGLRSAARIVANAEVPRPAAGEIARAVDDAETLAFVWPEGEYFHVAVLGQTDGQHHGTATRRPIRAEGLNRQVAACGFPVGIAPFHLYEDSGGSELEELRLFILGLIDFPFGSVP